jgi:tetratricopeptide (TPR) repeat protein
MMATLPEYKAQERDLLLKALDESNVAIKLKPTHIKARENRQNIFLSLQMDTSALKDAEALIAMDPRSSSAFNTKGFVYMRWNMRDSALYWFDKSLAVNPNADWILNNRGSLLFNRFERYNEALADFTRAIELNPTNGEYFLHRSYCHFKLGNLDKARADASAAEQRKMAVPDSYRKSLQTGN